MSFFFLETLHCKSYSSCFVSRCCCCCSEYHPALMLILESWAVIWLNAILFLELLPVTWPLKVSWGLQWACFPVWINILILNTDGGLNSPFYDDRNMHFSCVCVLSNICWMCVCVLSLSSHPQPPLLLTAGAHVAQNCVDCIIDVQILLGLSDV